MLVRCRFHCLTVYFDLSLYFSTRLRVIEMKYFVSSGTWNLISVNLSCSACRDVFHRVSDRQMNANKPPAATSRKSPAVLRSRPDMRGAVGASQPQRPAPRSHVLPSTRMHRRAMRRYFLSSLCFICREPGLAALPSVLENLWEVA